VTDRVASVIHHRVDFGDVAWGVKRTALEYSLRRDLTTLRRRCPTFTVHYGPHLFGASASLLLAGAALGDRFRPSVECFVLRAAGIFAPGKSDLRPGVGFAAARLSIRIAIFPFRKRVLFSRGFPHPCLPSQQYGSCAAY